MVPSTFKQRYAQICAIFGGTRRLNDGKPKDDCEQTAPYSLELKYGLVISGSLRAAMAQAVRNAPHGWLPTVVLMPKRWSNDECWVCFRVRDFRQWFLE